MECPRIGVGLKDLVYFSMAAVSNSENGASPQKTSEQGLNETPVSESKKRGILWLFKMKNN